jgi:hypothetical protein
MIKINKLEHPFSEKPLPLFRGMLWIMLAFDGIVKTSPT